MHHCRALGEGALSSLSSEGIWESAVHRPCLFEFIRVRGRGTLSFLIYVRKEIGEIHA